MPTDEVRPLALMFFKECVCWARSRAQPDAQPSRSFRLQTPGVTTRSRNRFSVSSFCDAGRYSGWQRALLKYTGRKLNLRPVSGVVVQGDSDRRRQAADRRQGMGTGDLFLFSFPCLMQWQRLAASRALKGKAEAGGRQDTRMHTLGLLRRRCVGFARTRTT